MISLENNSDPKLSRTLELLSGKRCIGRHPPGHLQDDHVGGIDHGTGSKHHVLRIKIARMLSRHINERYAKESSYIGKYTKNWLILLPLNYRGTIDVEII